MESLSVLKNPIVLPILSVLITVVVVFIFNKKTKDRDIMGGSYTVLLIIINLFVYKRFFNVSSIPTIPTIPTNSKQCGNTRRTRVSKQKAVSFAEELNEPISGGGYEDTPLVDSTGIDTSQPDF